MNTYFTIEDGSKRMVVFSDGTVWLLVSGMIVWQGKLGELVSRFTPRPETTAALADFEECHAP